jgi:hypothetical protein
MARYSHRYPIRELDMDMAAEQALRVNQDAESSEALIKGIKGNDAIICPDSIRGFSIATTSCADENYDAPEKI